MEEEVKLPVHRYVKAATLVVEEDPNLRLSIAAVLVEAEEEAVAWEVAMG